MPDHQELPPLLPCPFCGHIGLNFGNGSTYRWGLASCAGCDASAGETRREYPDKGEWHAQAIADWNKRSAPAVSGEASIVDPTRSAKDMRRFAALWRFGRDVLPAGCASFDSWLFQMDMLIDSKTHGLPFEECPPIATHPTGEVAARWQPIETAPKDGSEILAFKKSIGTVIVRHLDADHPDADGITEFHESWNHAAIEDLTHWMPLPTAPKQEQPK